MTSRAAAPKESQTPSRVAVHDLLAADSDSSTDSDESSLAMSPTRSHKTQAAGQLARKRPKESRTSAEAEKDTARAEQHDEGYIPPTASVVFVEETTLNAGYGWAAHVDTAGRCVIKLP